ncbi:hypothetical protein [Curtobacterium sp. MCPF17_011]|uniref:hypothetical protein n=1 Tax=Curtobacterium sp. MCPF17_011 TaxID=2175652 RepID=UPI0035C8A5BA
MGRFDVVEEQSTSDTVEDTVGNAGRVATLEAGVVLGADPGDEGDFLTAKPSDSAASTEVRQADLLRHEPGPPRCEEIADLRLSVHASTVRHPIVCKGSLSVTV